MEDRAGSKRKRGSKGKALLIQIWCLTLKFSDEVVKSKRIKDEEEERTEEYEESPKGKEKETETKEDASSFRIHPERVRTIQATKYPQATGVMYWMSRDQRALDNWALLYAQGT